MRTKHKFFDLWKNKKEREESWCTSCHAFKQGLRSSVGNQAGIEKLAIETRNNLNDDDQRKPQQLQKKG